MGEPRHIREIIPGVLSSIENHMDAAEQEERAKDRADRTRRILTATGEYMKGRTRQTRGKAKASK